MFTLCPIVLKVGHLGEVGSFLFGKAVVQFLELGQETASLVLGLSRVKSLGFIDFTTMLLGQGLKLSDEVLLLLSKGISVSLLQVSKLLSVTLFLSGELITVPFVKSCEVVCLLL